LDFSLSRVQVTIPVYQQMGEIRPPHYSASVEKAKEVAAHTTLSTPVVAQLIPAITAGGVGGQQTASPPGAAQQATMMQ